MSLSEHDLAQILEHCRDLHDAAAQLNHLAVSRYAAADDARGTWQGEHEVTFARRMEAEADELTARSEGLVADADSWARVWADTVNQINQQRRDDAVERERNSRGFGEQFVDIFHGDDSDLQVRQIELVSVPTAASRYAATGGLEDF